MPVNTIVIPCSSAASIDSLSLIEPPGCTNALIPYLVASSTQSLNGKNASDAKIAPSSDSKSPLACSSAC